MCLYNYNKKERKLQDGNVVKLKCFSEGQKIIIYLLINLKKSSIIITLKIVEWNAYGNKG